MDSREKLIHQQSHENMGMRTDKIESKLREGLAAKGEELAAAQVDTRFISDRFEVERQRAEAAEAKLKALEEQEPVAYLNLFIARNYGFHTIYATPKRAFDNQDALYAKPVPAEDSTVSHPDDSAVDAFSAKMKEKLAVARQKGRGGWDDNSICTSEDLSRMLLLHVIKGDPVDVANFCMMLSMRDERIEQEESPADVQELQQRAQFWVDRCGMLEARIAELERKLVEQQAASSAYRAAGLALMDRMCAPAFGVAAPITHRERDMVAHIKLLKTAAASQELNTLLSQAREKCRKEVLQEVLKLADSANTADYVWVKVSEMLAAAPKPEEKE